MTISKSLRTLCPLHGEAKNCLMHFFGLKNNQVRIFAIFVSWQLPMRGIACLSPIWAVLNVVLENTTFFAKLEKLPNLEIMTNENNQKYKSN